MTEEDVEDEDDEGNDGMGTHRHRYHMSEKILGKLFRAIDERAIWNEHYHQVSAAEGNQTLLQQVVGYVQSQVSAYHLARSIRPSRKAHRARQIRDL